jgi:DNA-binding Lrp family transcriptional regulator
MVKAFVMLHVDLGCEKDVLRELRRMNGVVEAYIVDGVYDAVVVLEAKGLEELKKLISKVRGMNNVQSTLTMIAVE